MKYKFIFIALVLAKSLCFSVESKNIDSLKIKMENAIITQNKGEFKQLVWDIGNSSITGPGSVAYSFYELYERCKPQLEQLELLRSPCLGNLISKANQLSEDKAVFSPQFQKRITDDVEETKELVDNYKKRKKEQSEANRLREREWKDVGIRSSEIKDFENIGVTADSAKKWIALHQTTMMIKEWQKNGIFSPDTAELWIKKGVTFEYIEKWSRVSLEVADEWLKVADLRVDVSHYISAGAKPNELKGWLDCHYMYGYESFEGTLEYDEIKKYNAANVMPSFVFAMKKQGLSVDDIVKQWKNVRKNCKEILPQDQLYSVNPYSTQGQCYEFIGSSIQLLSKNSGLYEGDGVSFVSIANGIIPKTVIGVAKSIGAYTYRSTLGAKQIVAKLNLIQFVQYQE